MANKIESTSYNIQEKWLKEIAPKYFDLKDINLLRVGAFGYINEIFSNSLEDTINMTNIVSNEIYPNKAVLPNSIYNYAALGNFSDFNAKPSSIKFTLALRKKDLEKYGKKDNETGNITYTISRYSILTIDKYNFMIDYSIELTLYKINNSNDYNVIAKYNFNYENDLSNITNPYIPSKIYNVEGDEYVFLNLEAKQLERQEFNFNIYSNELTETMKYDISYTGQLATFNVFYTDPVTNKKVQLKKYYVDSIKPEEDYFCFYQYPQENKISIVFSAYPEYFRPKFNSNLMIEVYTTSGEEGNFEYTGNDAEFGFYVDKNSSSSDNFSQLYHFVYIISNSTGGTNKMDMEQIKYNSIKAFSVRNNIISENDLDYYFREISDKFKLTFIKKRDDLIKRIYSAFILLKDNNNNLLPTNTADCYFDDDYTVNLNNSSNTMIKPGSALIVYDKENKKYLLRNLLKDLCTIFDKNNINSFEELAKMTTGLSNDEHDETLKGLILLYLKKLVTKYSYTVPFLIRINKNPLYLSYYLNSIYEKYDLDYSYIYEKSTAEFIINKFNLERNSFWSNRYKFSLALATNIVSSEILNEEDLNNPFETGNLKVLVFLKREDGEYLGYSKLNFVSREDGNNIFNYEGYIETDDFISDNDEIRIINSRTDGNFFKCYQNVSSTDNEILIDGEDSLIPLNNIYAEICVYYNYEKFNITENERNRIREKRVPKMSNYVLCNTFTTSTPIQLVKNISNIVYSTIVDDGENRYKINSLPLIRSNYTLNSDNMKTIITKLNYISNSLQGILNLIENNFDIDMKFYNTFGPSKYYTIGRQKQVKNGVSTILDTAELLDDIAISINLKIKLNCNLTDLIKNDIENYIVNFIESINNNEEINYIYVSDLISGLTKTFEYIKYIEFDSFNDYHYYIENNEEDNSYTEHTYQIIENKLGESDKMALKQVIKYVPEYINIIDEIKNFDKLSSLELFNNKNYKEILAGDIDINGEDENISVKDYIYNELLNKKDESGEFILSNICKSIFDNNGNPIFINQINIEYI